jgi:formamidopyrimidine-DNA glycosylase
MPELPEVETMRRGLAPLAGRTISAVRQPRCRYRPIRVQPPIASLRRRLVGQTISALQRYGKRLVLALESGDFLAIEPRMTGLVLLADPPDPHHVRLQLEFGGQPPLNLIFWDRRGLGTVRLYAAREPTPWADNRLGPDALEISWQELAARLGRSRRAIKVALLDQVVLAGVGNLYASEALYLARLDPRAPCSKITAGQWRALAAALRRVLRQAIRYEGSTLADGTYRNALNQSGSYQNHHRVYNRAGLPCRRCRTAIERIVQAQRSTFFCPHCQHTA